jgi:uncharacterized membrane protein YqiK
MSVPALSFIILICIAIAVFIIWLIYSRRYQKASQETAFVRTGFGGQKVVMNGGALVFPVLHEIIQVNMNTLRLEVTRSNQQALITKDRLRMDVQAEFYVRVRPTLDDIASAAQTLGRRTMNPDALKELVEGKFVNALRNVAADMVMDELHQNRSEFVKRVQEEIGDGLSKNGLVLESVSLSELEQTDRKYFNPQNAFDAQGLTLLTEMIQARTKQRNAIDRDSEVAIRKKDLEAEQQKLELSKEEEFSKLEQQREIEVRRAEQTTNIVQEKIERERQAKQAEIAAKQQVELAQLDLERTLEEQRIAKDQLLKEKDIASVHAVELAEIEKGRLSQKARIEAEEMVDRAKIMAERTLEEERIDKEQLLKEKEIAKTKTIEVADIGRAIALAEKTMEHTAAQAEVDKARATAVEAEERVVTARQIEAAERQKALEVLAARKRAECESISVTEAAQAKMKAATSESETVKIIAASEAEKIRRVAEAEAEAEMVKTKASEKRYKVDADGTRALHEAENVLDATKSASRIKMAIIEHLAEIIRESVKPIESIDGIKIFQVEGLTPYGNSKGSAETQAEGGNLADQIVNSALRYRGQAPLLDAILKEIGISGGDIHGLTAPIKKTDTEEKPEDE